MGKVNKRKKGKFFKRNKIAIFFFGVLFVYLSVTIISQEKNLRDLRQEQKELQAIVNNLKEEKKKMEKKVEESSELEFIEKTAREKLKMVKPNEIIYIIQDEE